MPSLAIMFLLTCIAEPWPNWILTCKTHNHPTHQHNSTTLTSNNKSQSTKTVKILGSQHKTGSFTTTPKIKLRSRQLSQRNLYLDHVDGLDDAGGEHARSATIDERLHSAPYSGLSLRLPLRHGEYKQKEIRDW